MIQDSHRGFGSDINDVSSLSARSSWSPFTNRHGFRKYVGPKRILLGGLFVGLIGLVWYLRQQGYINPQLLFLFTSRYPLMAPLFFVVFYASAVLFMIPTLPLNLGAGILWGPLWGSLIATAGSGLGAIGAFAVARRIIGQPLLLRFDNRIVVWLQNELETKGWKVVAFTRLNPIFPTGPLNFMFGITSIRFSTYVWSSLVFLFPLTLAFAIIGYEASSFVMDGEIDDLIRTIFIFSALITLMIIARVATKIIFCNKDKSL